MIATKQGDEIRFGSDFVDAATGLEFCRGWIQVAGKRYEFAMTQNVSREAVEHGVRLAASQSGRRFETIHFAP